MKLRSPKDFNVLISAPRFEVVEVMRFLAPCTVAELAANLGRAADTLYPHLRKLMKIGLVVEAGFRKTGRHAEQVFDLAADDVDFDALDSAQLRKVIVRMQSMFLSVAKRGLRDAFRDSLVVLHPPEERNMSILSFVARLTPADVKKIRQHTLAIVDVIHASRGSSAGTPFLWLGQLSPVVRGRRHRTKRRSK